MNGTERKQTRKGYNMKSRKRTEWTPEEWGIIDNIRIVQEALIPVNLPGVYGCYYYSPKDYKVPPKRRLIDSVGTVNSKRVYSCKAWLLMINDYIYIISYNTVIGAFSEKSGIYYSTGAYSMTTYQHERKALEFMRWECGIKPIEFNNLWIVDDFAQ